ncbi:MAG: nitronate monooxygenase [Acidimicrobiales bacterium]
MAPPSPARHRAEAFCADMGLRAPVLLAPMAGACPPALSAAVAGAGGMGACGALLMKPSSITRWAEEVRAATSGPFQLNLWIPDPPARRDPPAEAAVRAFLARWGPEVPVDAADAPLPDFDEQCEAMLGARPAVISSIMGLYPAPFVAALKARGVRWFATVTTVAEAVAAEAAGADAVVAQGMEAGGHRGAFDADQAARRMVGLFSLVPAVVDAVAIPVIATGGIGDTRGVAAALTLGASAAQVGTGFLRCPEAGTAAPWADGLTRTRPEDTIVTRAYSGRAGRAIATAYAVAATGPDAPEPAPYPVQRALTGPMRQAGGAAGDLDRMQPWAGQSAALARAIPAGELVGELWAGAQELLP